MSDSFAIVLSWCVLWGVTYAFVEPAILPTTIAHAEKVCEQNGGWKMIEEGNNPDATVYCKNGAEFNYNASEIHKEKQ